MVSILIIVLYTPSILLARTSIGSNIVYKARHQEMCSANTLSREELTEVYPESNYFGVCSQPGYWQRRYKKLGLENFDDLSDLVSRSPIQEYKAHTYKAAAQLQVEKDKCMLGMMDRLRRNQNIATKWIKAQTINYLRARRARLILDRCKTAFLEPVNMQGFLEKAQNESDHQPPMGFKKAWETMAESPRTDIPGQPVLWKTLFKSEQEKDRWKELCLDDTTDPDPHDGKKIEALQAASEIFTRSTPILNGERFQKYLDSQFEQFKLSDGRNLSDQVLLEMGQVNDPNTPGKKTYDFTFNSSDNVNPINQLIPPNDFGKGFYNELNEAFNNRKHQNDSLSKELQIGENQKDGHIYKNPFSGRNMDYLYAQGAVNEVLESKNQIQMKDGVPEPNNAGAICLLADHESSLLGETVDVLLWAPVGGGALVVGRGLLLKGGAMMASKGLPLSSAVTSATGFIGQNTKMGFAMNSLTAGSFYMSARDVVNSTCNKSNKAQLMDQSYTPNDYQSNKQREVLKNQKIGSAMYNAGSYEDDKTYYEGGHPKLGRLVQEDLDEDFKTVMRAPECKNQYAQMISNMNHMECWRALVSAGTEFATLKTGLITEIGATLLDGE